MKVQFILFSVLFLWLVTDHSTASRLLQQDKSEVLVSNSRPNPSTDNQKIDGGKILSCKEKADCKIMYEDTDYIYSHTKP
ncbi:hypothetical protein SUGI_1178600 [Cryptomeria japonica]|nr:hypothetical protein SUGI_1178600 [Cryptomeria japonica]